MVTNCYFSVRTITQTKLEDGYRIVVTSDVPCHLFMRWTTVEPQFHTVPRLRRGIAMHGDRTFCFVAYKDNEQEEVGDTLIHTFTKRNWPHCETRWFHFWGMVGDLVCKSTTAIFKKHFTAPPIYDVPSCWHNRYLFSSHGTWSTARNGYNPDKTRLYQRPTNKISVLTGLNASYNINRAYLNFDTHRIPSGKIITGAQLGLYITAKQGLIWGAYITRGLWDEPVVDTDWALQTNETTLLGVFNEPELIVGQYNWADFTQAGLDWLNQSALMNNQHESYDWGKTAYFPAYGDNRWSQSFTPIRPHYLRMLKLRLKKIGATRDLIIDIFEASPDGCPTGDLLAQCYTTSTFVSPDPWGDWFYARLNHRVLLEAGKTYCIVLWCKPADKNNCVHWIGATNTPYPSGHACYSTNSGQSWTSWPTYACYFIEYECEKWDEAQGRCAQRVGGTNLCLRTGADINDSPPGIHVNHEIQFYSAQMGEGYQPLLRLNLD